MNRSNDLNLNINCFIRFLSNLERGQQRDRRPRWWHVTSIIRGALTLYVRLVGERSEIFQSHQASSSGKEQAVDDHLSRPTNDQTVSAHPQTIQTYHDPHSNGKVAFFVHGVDEHDNAT